MFPRSFLTPSICFMFVSCLHALKVVKVPSPHPVFKNLIYPRYRTQRGKSIAKISNLMRGRKETEFDEIKGSLNSVNIHQSSDYVQDCILRWKLKRT